MPSSDLPRSQHDHSLPLVYSPQGPGGAAPSDRTDGSIQDVLKKAAGHYSAAHLVRRNMHLHPRHPHHRHCLLHCRVRPRTLGWSPLSEDVFDCPARLLIKLRNHVPVHQSPAWPSSSSENPSRSTLVPRGYGWGGHPPSFGQCVSWNDRAAVIVPVDERLESI